jgi:hypothetical protein
MKKYAFCVGLISEDYQSPQVRFQTEHIGTHLVDVRILRLLQRLGAESRARMERDPAVNHPRHAFEQDFGRSSNSFGNNSLPSIQKKVPTRDLAFHRSSTA